MIPIAPSTGKWRNCQLSCRSCQTPRPRLS
ncbi:hypothetical protein FZ029_16255 [Azospirillum sp. Sh1]|nr:hypothetical protein FZ029_16255 [Azospirillum sp. Sh1]